MRGHYEVLVLCGGIRGSFVLRDRETGEPRQFASEEAADVGARAAPVVWANDWPYQVRRVEPVP